MVSDPTRPVKTTLKSINLVQLIMERDGATQGEIAEALDMARSTLHNHLTTLVSEGLLVEEDGKYHVGLRFLEFGEHARNRESLYRPAKIQTYRLAEATNEEVNFAVEEHGFMYTLEYVMGDANPANPEAGSQFLKVGSKFRMHNSASGKAILAELEQGRVNEILEEHGLPQTTDKTTTDKSALFDELQKVRDQRYATNDEELERGYRSIAAPINGPGGSTLGALSIGGPAYRFELTERKLAEPVRLLLDTVDEVEEEINQLVKGTADD